MELRRPVLVTFLVLALAGATTSSLSGALAGLAWRGGGVASWTVWMALVALVVVPLTALELARGQGERQGRGASRDRLGARLDNLELINGLVLLAALWSLALRLALPTLSGAGQLSLALLSWSLLGALCTRRVDPVVAVAGAVALGCSLGASLGAFTEPDSMAAAQAVLAPRLLPLTHPQLWSAAGLLALGTTGLGIGLLPELGRSLAPRAPALSVAVATGSAAALLCLLLGLGDAAWLGLGPLAAGPGPWDTAVVALSSGGPLPVYLKIALPAGVLVASLLVLRRARRHLAGTLGTGSLATWAAVTALGLWVLTLCAPGVVLEVGLPGRGDSGLVVTWLLIGWTAGAGVPLVLLGRVLSWGWLPGASARLASLFPAADSTLSGRQTEAGRWLLRWLLPLSLGVLLVLLARQEWLAPRAASLEDPALGRLDGILHALVGAAWFSTLALGSTTLAWLRRDP